MRIGVKRIEFDYDGQEAWVDIKRPSVSEVLGFADSIKGDDWQASIPAMYGFLELCLVDWNFEDTKGKALKVDAKTIRQLPVDLVILLVRKVQEVAIEIPLVSKRRSTEAS